MKKLYTKPISPFRKPIIWRYSGRFNRFKTASLKRIENEDPTFLQEFENQAYEIHNLVMQTKYWHGTGRRQYQTKGQSKYDGVEHRETFDVLETLVEQNGLIPKYDPWFEKYMHTPYSISVANQWSYGKLYASYHQFEQIDLRFEIAPVTFWYQVQIWIQFTENLCKFMFGFLILYTFSNALQKQGKTWMATFRSDTNKKWPYKAILTARSDIPSNYGMLFGIKGELKTIPVMRLAQFLESRTDEPIPFKKMNFVSVPYTNLVETETFLHERNVPLPVIPLEFLELYMTRYSLREIVMQEYLK